MPAERSETESDRLPATRMKGRTRTISRLPLPRVVVDTRMTWRAALASPGGGRRSALRVDVGHAIDDAADGAAQRGFHALGHGGEVGFAVERREDGAAHERGAAQAGENGAAEPLYGDAVAVHQAAALAVDGQRRFVAEIDALGLPARSKCPASFALIQARRPLRPRPGRSPQHRRCQTRPGRWALT